MKWYGKDIYCTRGETFALDCSVVNEDGTPYRISTLLENAFLLITVTSTVYKEEGRYLYRGWINLADFPKVEDMTILELDELPEGDDLIRNRLIKYNKTYYIYSEEQLKYVEYGFRLVHSFSNKITKDWLDKCYEYDVKLLAGTLKDDYIEAVKSNIKYDGVPFKDVTFDMNIIEKSKIYVNENSSGGDYFG